jgi:hypothetical protein
MSMISRQMLMALYMHFGPFSKRVISEIDRRIAELDGMPLVRVAGRGG